MSIFIFLESSARVIPLKTLTFSLVEDFGFRAVALIICKNEAHQ
jgi:hypothetical protein